MFRKLLLMLVGNLVYYGRFYYRNSVETTLAIDGALTKSCKGAQVHNGSVDGGRMRGTVLEHNYPPPYDAARHETHLGAPRFR